jgi:hypothetical protein
VFFELEGIFFSVDLGGSMSCSLSDRDNRGKIGGSLFKLLEGKYPDEMFPVNRYCG